MDFVFKLFDPFHFNTVLFLNFRINMAKILLKNRQMTKLNDSSCVSHDQNMCITWSEFVYHMIRICVCKIKDALCKYKSLKKSVCFKLRMCDRFCHVYLNYDLDQSYKHSYDPGHFLPLIPEVFFFWFLILCYCYFI